MTELVKMLRDPATNQPPFEAMVNPLAVDDYRAGGFVLEDEVNFETERDRRIASVVSVVVSANDALKALEPEDRDAVMERLKALAEDGTLALDDAKVEPVVPPKGGKKAKAEEPAVVPPVTDPTKAEDPPGWGNNE